MSEPSRNPFSMSGLAEAWKVPKKTLLTATTALLLILVPAGLVGWLAGLQPLLAFLFGVAFCSPSAKRLRPKAALQLIAISSATAAVAVSLNGVPFAAACFIVLVALLAAPPNVHDNGLLRMLVGYTVVFVASPVAKMEPSAAALWTFLGGLLLVLLLLKVPKPEKLQGIPASTAYRHAVVMALAVGTATYLVMRFQVPHGYWIPMTMAVVLQPFGQESRDKARLRIWGTVGGAVVAMVLAILLPPWGIALALVPLNMLNVSYTLLGRYGQAVVFLTPTVVLMANLSPEAEIEATVQRLIATLIGGLAAAGLAFALEDVDARSDATEKEESDASAA